jgi:hypothetical protein
LRHYSSPHCDTGSVRGCRGTAERDCGNPAGLSEQLGRLSGNNSVGLTGELGQALGERLGGLAEKRKVICGSSCSADTSMLADPLWRAVELPIAKAIRGCRNKRWADRPRDSATVPPGLCTLRADPTALCRGGGPRLEWLRVSAAHGLPWWPPAMPWFSRSGDPEPSFPDSLSLPCPHRAPSELQLLCPNSPGPHSGRTCRRRGANSVSGCPIAPDTDYPIGCAYCPKTQPREPSV